MNTDTLPTQGKTWVQIAGISALFIGLLQLYFFISTVWELISEDAVRFLPQIILSNNAFYLAGILLTIGGIGLLMERPWAWILVTGAVAFRIVMIFWRWILMGKLDLFHVEGVSDVLYILGVAVSLLAMVLLLLPDTRRYLRLDGGLAAFAVVIPCLLLLDNVMVKFLNQYLFF